MSGLEIRLAHAAEQKPLFTLHEKLFREEIEEIWGWDDASQWRNFLTEWTESSTFAVCQNGCLAGCIQFYTRTDHLYLFNLAIEPEFQNQGIGSAAVSWLKREAAHRHLGIELKSLKTNPRILSFYQRLGFGVVEEIDTGFRLRWE